MNVGPTLHHGVVEQVDQAEWSAVVTNDVVSKCTVYVEEPRDTFVVPLKSQRADEKGNATFECDTNDKDIDVEWYHDGAKIKMDGVHFKVGKHGWKENKSVNQSFDDCRKRRLAESVG